MTTLFLSFEGVLSFSVCPENVAGGSNTLEKAYLGLSREFCGVCWRVGWGEGWGRGVRGSAELLG